MTYNLERREYILSLRIYVTESVLDRAKALMYVRVSMIETDMCDVFSFF